MLNIKESTIAQLKQFASENNLIVEGDRRLRATWERAIALYNAAKAEAMELAKETAQGAVECLTEVLTYDNAVIVANTANVWSRRSLRFLWSAFLVTVALVCIGIDLVENRSEVKEVLITVYRRMALRLRDRLSLYEEMGEAWFQVNIKEPFMQIKILSRFPAVGIYGCGVDRD